MKVVGCRSDMSPLSLSVQCGSDSDDVDAGSTAPRETAVVVATHRLRSRRVWNVATRSWDDDDDDDTDAVPQHTTPDSRADLSPGQNTTAPAAGKMIFTRAGTSQSSGATLRAFAGGAHRSRYSFSDGDIRIRRRSTENQSTVGLRRPAAVRNVDSRNRHTVLGGSYDEQLVCSWRQQLLRSLRRARSCPDVATAFCVLRAVQPGLGPRRKVSRLVGRVRQTVPGGSERRRKVRRVIGRRTLPPPLLSSWPGRADVKGSMLEYESSV